jgi:lipopolysaccharide transport system permease protein
MTGLMSRPVSAQRRSKANMSSPALPQRAPNTLVVEKATGWSSLGLHDLWEYRELLYFLAWREIQGAYRQTALGLSWLFLRPIISTLLMTFVFSGLLRVASDDAPYPLFVLAAMIPWTFFSNAVIRSSRSLVDNMQIISKVYFPRMIVPVAGTTSGLVDFSASFLVFLGAFVLYGLPLRLEMLALPVFTLLAIGYALAVGLWLATLSVTYRDVSFAINFLLQALMYLSPVFYSANEVPVWLRPFYLVNPMTQVIEGFRWCLIGSSAAPGILLPLSGLLVVIGLISGAYVFRRTERTVVDIL